MLVKVSDKYLMVVNENDTLYKHPGGHVNSEESLKDAIIREVKEEIGFELKNNDISSVLFYLVDIEGNLMINGYSSIEINDEIAEKFLAESPLKSRLFKLEELNDENTYKSEIEVVRYFLRKK